jgi:hypothetical protein
MDYMGRTPQLQFERIKEIREKSGCLLWFMEEAYTSGAITKSSSIRSEKDKLQHCFEGTNT